MREVSFVAEDHRDVLKYANSSLSWRDLRNVGMRFEDVRWGHPARTGGKTSCNRGRALKRVEAFSSGSQLI
jgi:hypothetical protein